MLPYLRNSYINATGEFLAAIFLLVILLSSFLRKKGTPTKRPFCLMTGTLIALLAESALAWTLDGIALSTGSTPALDAVRHALIGLDYLLYSTLDDFFFFYLFTSVSERRAVGSHETLRAKRLFAVLFSLSMLASAVFASSFWTGSIFTLDAYGGMNVTPAYLLLTLVGASAEFVSFFTVLREWKALGTPKAVSCLIYLVVPCALVYVDITYRLTTSYVFCALVIFTIYIAVDLRQDRALIEQEAQVAKSETEKTDMKVALMMSQIQPHFLYNSLSSIAYLCRKNPKEAEIAVTEFADYLRMNLRSINNKLPILFEAELSHTETYLKIQKRRFPEQLIVDYDIQAKEFRIPALTLQPIVENAVKHAVETRFEPTTIHISTRETEDAYLITVQDNGPGFDVTAVPQDDRPHIGIASTKTRLANMVQGSMDIESTPGMGTTVCVRIPKRGEEAAT